MQLSEEEMILDYLEQLPLNIEYRDQDELISNVQALVDLSRNIQIYKDVLFDKINELKNQLNENQRNFDDQIQSQKNEIAYQKTMIQQLEKMIQDSNDLSQVSFDRIVVLEEELQRQSSSNYAIMKQLEQVVRLDDDKMALTQMKELLDQYVIEIDNLKSSQNFYKDNLQKLKEDKQQLLSMYNYNVEQSKTLDLQNKNQLTEIALLKNQLKLLKEQLRQEYCGERSNPLTRKNSALQDISNQVPSSPQFHKSKQTNKLISLTNSYMRESDLKMEVGQFTILENELTDGFLPQTARFQNSIIFEEKSPQKSRNIYYDFFVLLSQCAKLNCMNMERVLDIKTSHLYDLYLEKKIPYHKWYKELEKYLSQFL